MAAWRACGAMCRKASAQASTDMRPGPICIRRRGGELWERVREWSAQVRGAQRIGATHSSSLLRMFSADFWLLALPPKRTGSVGVRGYRMTADEEGRSSAASISWSLRKE